MKNKNENIYLIEFKSYIKIRQLFNLKLYVPDILILNFQPWKATMVYILA